VRLKPPARCVGRGAERSVAAEQAPQRTLGQARFNALPRLAATSRADPYTGRRTPDHRTALWVGILGALSLAILSAVLKSESIPHGDDLIYEDIARSPFGVHSYPFGFRIGLPLVVHLLPFGYGTSFLILAWLAAGGAAMFAYLLMTQLGTGRRVAIGLALLLAISPPILVVALRHGRNTDIATVFLMMAATYFIVRRAYWSVAVVLVLGTTVREALLFEIPLAYTLWATRPLDKQALLRTLQVGLPAVGAYIGLRLGINTVGKSQVPGYSGSLIGERLTVIKLGFREPAQEARRLFTVYGPLWLVAPIALRDMPFARRGLVLALAAIVSMTFALDWGRMLLLAAPLFYPASGFVLTRNPRWAKLTFAAFLALAIGYAVYMDISGVRTGIIDAQPPPYPVR
jgi:hypothetical protein